MGIAQKGGKLFMLIIKTIQEMRDYVSGIKTTGGKIGFVPTMGYLHEGHLVLIERQRNLHPMWLSAYS